MTFRSLNTYRAVLVLVVMLTVAAGVPTFAGQQGPSFLTGPKDGDPLVIVLDYIETNSGDLGLTAADLSGLRSEQYVSAGTGITHIRLVQRHADIDVWQGEILANVASDGSIINLHNRFVDGLANRVESMVAALSPVQAIEKAAEQLGLAVTETLILETESSDPSRESLVSEGGISRVKIPVRLVWLVDTSASLAWDLSIHQLDQRHWWSLRVDAETGAIVDRGDWVVHEDFEEQRSRAMDATKAPTRVTSTFGQTKSLGGSADGYMVYEWPRESPLHNPQGIPGPPDEGRTLQIAPWTPASPFGWHDTDGSAGPEFTITRGNNVFAYEDTSVTGSGFSPDCGPLLECNFPLDLSLAPITYQSAAVANLFYWNNIIHDVWYNYGFDEVSGNFQENNYGNGGLGVDSVKAEAQDGGGNCNANFGTPVDGGRPTMQMYTCNNANPSRDGDFDNGVIAHEYGHGISIRLTGGPNNSGCLNNSEQMGEGWSDWIALIMTVEPGDLGTDSRGIGTYLFGQPPDGPGIRPLPYSTDFAVNNATYGSVAGQAIPHGVGWVWATMLWEMSWELVNNGVSHSGLDPDIYAGTGGNNLAMQLVTDGMKLQPCSPGFVDGRDAILLADQNLTGGVNQCAIWEAFARRGLGFSADQGSSGSISDGTEAFDLPASCLQNLKIDKTATPDPALPGSNVTYNLVVTNDTPGPLTAVTMSDAIPAGTTYVSGSATCGGVFANNELTFALGDMASAASVTCTFEVMVDQGVQSTLLFYDDLESGFGDWAMTGLWNTENDDDACGGLVAPFPSPTTAAYYGRDGVCNFDTGAQNSGEMTLLAPFDVTGIAPELTIWSFESTENNTSFDKKFVDVSVDGGGTWVPLAQLDSEGSWYEAAFDLSPYLGSSALIRFRFDSTDGIGNENLGWMVDEIVVVDQATIVNTACVAAAEGDQACDTVITEVAATFGLDLNPDSVEVCAGSDGVFDVDLTSFGITDPVALSAVSSPPGASMAFGANPVTPAGSTTLTVSAPATAYAIEVSGVGGGLTVTDAASLLLFGPVGVVGLVAPADAATGVALQPTFEWTVAPEAASYLIEVASDPGFADIVHSATVAETSYQPAASLPPSTTFFWRVTPNNVCGAGAQSSAFSFTTVSLMCSTPGLAIPDDDPVGIGDTMSVAMSGAIIDLDVVINSTHTFVGDLIFTVSHESGASVVVIDRPGVPASTFGCAGDNVAVTMDDDGAEPVEDFCGNAPALFGSLIPNNPLAAFNGEEISGNWTLSVSDNANLDTGTFDSWCLVPTVDDSRPAGIFSDGFELGDTSAWSDTMN